MDHPVWWRFWLGRLFLWLMVPFVVVTPALMASAYLFGGSGVNGWDWASLISMSALFVAIVTCGLVDFIIFCVDEEEIRRIALCGIPAEATVLKVERTGVFDPGEFVRFRLDVRPLQHPLFPAERFPFQAEGFEVLFHRIEPGETVEVRYDPSTKRVVMPEKQAGRPTGDF
jgi:hypothetical protein